MDPSPVRVPDGIEPLVGYRRWRYTIAPDGTSLSPLMHFVMQPSGRSAWAGAESRWVVARCYVEPMVQSRTPMQALRDILAVIPGDERGFAVQSVVHEVPVEGCTCGFYALRALMPELLVGPSLRPVQRDTGTVLGRVLLAGKVIEHDEGYRAERARIAELIPVKGDERWVKCLADRLELPVGLAVERI